MRQFSKWTLFFRLHFKRDVEKINKHTNRVDTTLWVSDNVALEIIPYYTSFLISIREWYLIFSFTSFFILIGV